MFQTVLFTLKKPSAFFYKIIQATDGSTGGSEEYSSDIVNNRDDNKDDDEEEDDFNNFPPKPAALIPRMDSITGGVDNSFSAGNEQVPDASTQGGTCSAAADNKQGRESSP
jgi:hypothetical protein